MGSWLATDWAKLFMPQMSLPEMIARSALVYLSLCLMLRVVLKRQRGRVALSDLLVVTLVAGVCRNPLVCDAYSITDGMLVVALVLFWSYLVDWLSFRSPFVHRLVHAPPLMLICNGEILHEHLKQELMTESQLHSKLRRKGIARPEEVAEAYMESNGEVTVIKRESHEPCLPRLPADRADAQGHLPPEADRSSGDGAAAGIETDVVAAFLRDADRLKRLLEWHQERQTEIREALTRHGVRVGSLTRTLPTPRANGCADRGE